MSTPDSLGDSLLLHGRITQAPALTAISRAPRFDTLAGP